MTNTRRLAAAITYNQTKDNAPRITAKGKGFLAKDILELAKENNIPVVKDPALLELLSQLHINDTIPPTLFEAVAEVFAFIYHLDQSMEREVKFEPSKID